MNEVATSAVERIIASVPNDSGPYVFSYAQVEAMVRTALSPIPTSGGASEASPLSEHCHTAGAGHAPGSAAGNASDELARADHARTVYARALEKMRLALVNVHDGLEDEGDRIYLGSTNHADDLRAAWQTADALSWDEILEDTQPKTPLAEINLQLQVDLAEARAAFDAAPGWKSDYEAGHNDGCAGIPLEEGLADRKHDRLAEGTV